MNNDYVDFKFGDHWASEFNLLAVSDGDRHNPPVYGTVNANTATIMGKKGVYKWKTQVNEKIFNINIAFDSVTIAQLNQIKQWLEPHKVQKLIFADEPYKYYWAALNGEIDFKFLPFVEGEKKVGERTIIEGVYKGEMTISFICIDNDGYSEESTFEGLENKNQTATAKGSNIILTDADNDYIEDLKIEGKSEQEEKYNNVLSDTNFAKVNGRSVEKDWKTNNLATIESNNGEVIINAPYEYSGIAQEHREAIIDHKYYVSAEVNTNNENTALEVAGKNITNSIQGKDINITDGLIGNVDDLVVGGDAEQEQRYDNKIESSFLEDLDNWNSINDSTISRDKQQATIVTDKKFGGMTQNAKESIKGDKYYLSAKVKASTADTVLEVETDKETASASNINSFTVENAADREVENFEISGNSYQDKYEEKLLGKGENITVTDNTYSSFTKIKVGGNSVQETQEAIKGTSITGTNVKMSDVDSTKEHKIMIKGNMTETDASSTNPVDIAAVNGTIEFTVRNSANTQPLSINVQQPLLTDDYLDFDREKEIHNWSTITFDGTEKWALNATYTDTMRFSLGASYLNMKQIGYCNRSFVRTTQAHGDYEYINLTNNILYFNIAKSSLPSDNQNLTGFKALLAEWNTNGAPLELYYKTGTVTELDFKPSQIVSKRQINNCKFYDGYTRVYCDDTVSPIFEVVYNFQKAKPALNNISNIKNCSKNITVKINGSASKTITFPLVDGQKLMKGDYFAKDGIHHVRKQKVLDGTENWSNNTALSNNNYNVFYIYLSDMKSASGANLLCNYLKAKNNRGTEECIYAPYSTELDFSISAETISSLENWTAFVKEKYDDETPIIVEYELAQEEIEPYTTEQQKAYYELTHLTMYQGNNILSSDDTIKPQLEWLIPASPSLDYPSNIVSCGDNKKIDFNIHNKNLIDLRNMREQTINGITLTCDKEKQSITFNGTCMESNTHFDVINSANILMYKDITSFVVKRLSGTASGYARARCATNNWDIMFNCDLSSLNDNNNMIASTLSVGYTSVARVDFRFDKGAVLNNLTIQMKLANDASLDYEIFKRQFYSFPLQQPLRALGNYKDSIIKKNGKWYERHYIARKVFDGTEDFELWGNGTNSSYRMVFKGLVNKIKKNDSIISNCYFTKLATELYEGVVGIATDTNGYIIVHDNDYTTVDEFKALLKAQYNAGEPVYIDYVLSQPIDIEINFTDKISLFRGKNTLQFTTELPVDAKIEYVKAPQYQTQLTTANTEQLLSLIYQTTIDNSRILISNIKHDINTVSFTNPVLVNLTKTFGASQEPTKEWCDQNLSFFNCAEGGAPSYKTSSKIKTVGSNINLFNPNTHIELDGKYRGYGAGSRILDNSEYFGLKIPVLGDAVYSVSANVSRGNYSNLCFFDKDFNYMWGFPFTDGNEFRTPNGCRYITLALKKNYSWFKLEYGKIVTQPSNYNFANIDMKISGYDNQYKSFPLLEGQELLQFPNGTQDTIQLDGVHKKIGRYIVTGQEQFVDNNTYAIIALSNCKNNSKVYCNYFINKENGAGAVWGVSSGIAFGYDNNLRNLNELKTFLQTKFNSTDPVIIYYELNTEQIMTFSNAQKAWYDDFSIYRKNTQITTVAEVKPYYSFTYDINDTYAVNSTKVNEYEKLGLIFNNLESRPRFIVNSTADANSIIKMRKPIVMDLTNEFGVGKEPTLEWCQENINFDNVCEYGTPSPAVASELKSVGTTPVKIENKSRNLIAEQNLLNWTNKYCEIEKLTEKLENRNVYRVKFENHHAGNISIDAHINNTDLVFSVWARVIQADTPTANMISVTKTTASTTSDVCNKSLENKIGEWQKVYVPILGSSISDAIQISLNIVHNTRTDDSTIIDLSMPQLEEGFTPHEFMAYAPYRVNNIILPEPLRALPNGVKDEFSKAGIVRRVGKFVINENTNMTLGRFNLNKQYVTILGKTGIYVRGDSTYVAPVFCCDRFKDCTSLADIYTGGTSSREKEGIGITDSQFRLCIRADLIDANPATDDFNAIIRKFKVWLQSNPITIYYEKEVAEIEPLTELQINTLNNLITRKLYDNWVVSGSMNPEIELTYRLSSSINDIHPWVTGSNLLDKTWLYNDNNIHTKSYIDTDTGDATQSGISASRPVYLLNSGTTDANLDLKFDYITIISPLTIKVSKGYMTDEGFNKIAQVSEITIKPFTNYQPFVNMYDGKPDNWYINIDSTLGEVYLRNKMDDTKVLNLNRFNDDHTFLTLASCNFVDYNKVFPTIISEIEDTAIEHTIFNKLTVAPAPEAYRLKNASIEWKHTYL